jgi:hypothetical protein
VQGGKQLFGRQQRWVAARGEHRANVGQDTDRKRRLVAPRPVGAGWPARPTWVDRFWRTGEL